MDKNSAFNIPINYANMDIDLLERSFIDFFKNNPDSPFKDYPSNAAGMRNVRQLLIMLMHYNNFYLNMALSENYLNKAVLDDSVYNLIHNFNFIPFAKTPATAYMKILLYRGRTDLTKLTVSNAATFAVNETIYDNAVFSSATKSAEILIIDTINNDLYVGPILSDFIATDTAYSTSVPLGDTISAHLTNQDYYSTDDSDSFTMRLTYFDYSDGDYGAPTTRDVYQEVNYIQSTLDIDNENKAVLDIEPYIDSDNNRRYLKASISVSQINWRTIEINNIASITNADGSQHIYLTIDGLKDANSIYKDCALKDTVRMFVLPNGKSNWSTQSIEYQNLNLYALSPNLYNFKLKYDQTYGLYIKLNISNFSKQMVTGDRIRIIFATTKGDDINDLEGINEFNPSDSTLEKIGYFQVLNSSSTVLFEVEESNTPSTGSATYTEDGTDYDTVTLELVTEDEVLTTFLNGQDKQDIDSIKEIAPLFFNSQGRAVNTDDFYPLIKGKFTEFRDVAVWSGAYEFIDLKLVLEDVYATTPISSLSTFKTAFKEANFNVNKYPVLAVESIYNDSVEAGNYKQDLGHVYYSLVGNNFDFETNTSTYEMIEDFIDGKKIETIYMKRMYPTYIIIKPNITISVNKAYINTIDVADIKQRIRTYINDNSYYAKKTLSIESLKSTIQNFDEVNFVSDINISYSVKIKPIPVAITATPTYAEYTYLRVFNQLSGNIGSSATINATDNNGKKYKFYSDSSGSPSVIKIVDVTTGITYTSSDWIYNNNLGMMRFQYDFNGADYVRIDNIPIKNTNNIIMSNKEAILGVEYVSDINIVLI
jgi:hypothetical protein